MKNLKNQFSGSVLSREQMKGVNGGNGIVVRLSCSWVSGYSNTQGFYSIADCLVTRNGIIAQSGNSVNCSSCYA